MDAILEMNLYERVDHIVKSCSKRNLNSLDERETRVDDLEHSNSEFGSVNDYYEGYNSGRRFRNGEGVYVKGERNISASVCQHSSRSSGYFISGSEVCVCGNTDRILRQRCLRSTR